MENNEIKQELNNLKEEITKLKRIDQSVTKSGIKNYFRKAFGKTNVLVGIFITFLVSSLAVYATVSSLGTISSFTSGTAISSAAINTNFANLKTTVDALVTQVNSSTSSNLSIPDDLSSGSVVNAKIGQAVYYPSSGTLSGKTLYIFSSNAEVANKIRINDVSYYDLNMGVNDFKIPLIIGSGNKINAEYAGDVVFTGIEVAESTSIFHRQLLMASTVELSTTKDTYILSIFFNNSGTLDFGSGGGRIAEKATAGQLLISLPILIKKNTSVVTGAAAHSYITGYYK